MVGMAESVAIRARVGARWPVRFLIVANAARCDFAPCVGFTRRRVARVAIVMGRKVCGNRQASASIYRRIVTTGAASLRARRSGVVLSVIELNAEGFVEARREILQRRIVTADVGVTDHTHRGLRRVELAAMTISTGFVTGKAWCC